MIPFSFHFSIEYGMRNTGYKFGIVLNSCQRNLQLLTDDMYTFVLFIYSIKKSLSENHYLEINRYGSFARERENCEGKFYIDGEDYFRDIYEELLRAKKEIFITDWMITPYFLFIRPNSLDSEYRMDKVLKKVAEKGVKINIILFLEPKLALNNDSEYAK
jgi:phospholipase D1/2